MSSYEGLTIGDMVQYVLTKCKKANWDINRVSLVKLFNMSLAEFEADSQLTLAYWEAPTEEDIAEYLLPTDMGVIHDVYIKETTGVGGIPLIPASFKQYQATLADDEGSEVVEP
jgi:hypothetical protein